MLLVVVPESRLETVSQQFARRLREVCVSISLPDPSAGVYRADVIDFVPALSNKPILAITSWTKLLSAIEAELTDEPHRRNDLLQLRALCDAAEHAGSLRGEPRPTILGDPQFLVFTSRLVGDGQLGQS